MPRELIKHYFWFPEKISIWISRVNKEQHSCAHQGWADNTQSLESLKGGGRVNSLFPAGTSVSSCPQTSEPQALGSSDSYWTTPLTFLGLQFAKDIPWQVSASIIMQVNSHNKSPLIYIYKICVHILLVLLIWRTLTNT